MKKANKAIITAITVAALVSGSILSVFTPSPDAAAVDTIEITEPPFDDIQLGISGYVYDVSAEKLIDAEDETVFVATSTGLYALQQGQLQSYVPLSSQITNMATVEDISGDGKREIVITLDESHYSNVRCYDPATGESLWQYSHTQRVFVEDIGWTTVSSIPSRLRIIDNDRIAFTVRDKLIMLDSNGHLVGCIATELDYLEVVQDINGDGVSDLLGAMINPTPETAFKTLQVEQRYHKLYLFSGRNGKLISCIQKIPKKDAHTDLQLILIGAFNMQSRSKATMLIHYKDRLVDVDEYRLYLINLESRAIDWEIVPFASREGEFSDRDVRNVGDINEDDYDDILELAEKEIRTPWGPEWRTMIMLYDGQTQEKLWDADMVIGRKLSSINSLSLNSKAVLVTTGINVHGATFDVYDIAQGEQYSTIEVDRAGSDPNVYQYDANSYLYYYGHELLHISDQGDIISRNPVTINSAITARGDLTGDETDDFLLYSNDNVRYSSSVTRSLCVVDGATRQKAWTYTVPDLDTVLDNIEIVPDLDGDGKQDIAGVMSTSAIYNPDGIGEYKIVEFSGSGDAGNAKVLSETPLTEGYNSVAFIPYEASYAYAALDWDSLLVIDRDGNVLWETTLPPSEEEYAEVVVVGDINEDEIPDLAALSEEGIIIYKSDTWPNYTDHITYQADFGETFEHRDGVYDFDGDGVTDLMFIRERRVYPVGQHMTVFSPVSGQVLLEADDPQNALIVKPANADFNDDGYADSIVFQGTTSGSRYSDEWWDLKLWVASGRDGDSIYDIDLSAIPDSLGRYSTVNIGDVSVMPATPIADMNGDGVAELAVFTMELSEDDGDDDIGGFLQRTAVTEVKSRPVLIIYDIAQGEELKTFPVIEDDAFQNRQLHITMQELGDINGNGSNDVALITDVGITIVDVEAESTISKFSLDALVETAYVVDDQTIGLAIWGGLYLYNASSDFEIVLPATGAAVNTPVRVSWDGGAEETSTRVLVNSVFTGQTRDNHFDLSLKQGNYKITVASQDQYGKTYYSTVIFTATKGVSSAVFAILLLISLIAVLLVLKFYKRMRKAKLKRGGWLRKTS